MADPYYGEIRTVAFGYAPYNWAPCNGQLMPIAQNTGLYSVLGTTYGGDGRMTFALPNLNGHLAMGQGDGPGLTPRSIGIDVGSATVTLLSTEMPRHTHVPGAVDAAGTSGTATDGVWAQPRYGRVGRKAYASAADVPMRGDALAVAGGSQPHNNLPPVLGMYFVIALVGEFPPHP